MTTTVLALALVAGAGPAQAEYLSAPDARYYARDAVRTSIPNAIRVTANCGARVSSSFFKCSVSWRKPFKPKRYGTVRVRAIDGDRIRSDKWKGWIVLTRLVT